MPGLISACGKEEKAMKLKVPGISCNHCVMRIMNALKPLPGMGNITVDIDKKTVEITGEPDIQAVTRAIEQAGYTIES